MSDNRRHKDLLIKLLGSLSFIIVVAFAARTTFICYYFISAAQRVIRENLPFGYEAGAVAAAIAGGRGFSSPLRMVQTGPTVWFTPIYPYLLAGIFKLFGIYSYTSDIVIRFIDIAFSALTCWPIYTIAARAFSKRSAAAAAWLWAFLPMSLFFSTVWVWDTALTALMLAWIVAATLVIRGSQRLSFWMGYGALWALGAMVNPSVLSVLPALALWAIWPLRRQFAPAAKLTLGCSLVFCAGIAPWTIRNYVVFHKFIPFRSNFALELWLGNNPGVPDSWSPWLHPNDDASEAAKYAQMTEIPYMEMKKTQALEFMRSHPLDVLNFTLHRFSNNWIGLDQPPAEIWNQVPLKVKLIILGDCIFPLLSLAGVLLAYREQNEAAVPLAAVMIFFPLVFYVTHSSGRYRHPMDPVMLVLATYAMGSVWNYFSKRLDAMRNPVPVSSPAE